MPKEWTKDEERLLTSDAYISEWLARIAFYFYTTYGLPLEYFKEQIQSLETKLDQVLFILNFQKSNPLYESKSNFYANLTNAT